MRSIKRAIALAGRVADTCFALQPIRPVVIIQSDDWGQVGTPDLSVLSRLRSNGMMKKQSKWDCYGAETKEDLQRLGQVLSEIRDIDGNPACMTANIIMANADLRLMKSEGFEIFRAIPIKEGFPDPWPKWDVTGEYKKLIEKGVMYPALHGYTHYSPEVMIDAWHDKGDFGSRARALFDLDIPSSPSLTPEFNFALLSRNPQGEVFASERVQREWIDQGLTLFRECFGFAPVSTCAPGYRANDITIRLWSELGFRVFQTGTPDVPRLYGNILQIPRTVHFEPVFAADLDAAVRDAYAQAVKAVEEGKMIVICSHSINYIEQHLGAREKSLGALKQLLEKMLSHWPNLRFTNDGEVYQKFAKDSGWFASPDLVMNGKRFR